MPSRNTSRRLLATLSAAPAGATSATAPAALLPPYTHALPNSPGSSSSGGIGGTGPSLPSSAFRPPYTFVLPDGGGANAAAGPSANLKAKLQFKLLGPSEYAERRTAQWREWAEDLVSTEEGRSRVQKAWVASIIGLERAKSAGNRTPEVSFQTLAVHLRSDTALEAVRNTGSLVVRDVIPDGQASAWAKEILEQLEARDGHPVYWSDAQIAARSNPSILSANNQVSASLLSAEAEPFIQADAVQLGVADRSTLPHTGDIAGSPWSGASSLVAHLALTPSRATLPATAHAATYSLLRPLFRPLRSLLSFYHASGYLDPANWAMLDASEIAAAQQVVGGSLSADNLESQGKKWFPHLEETWTSTDLAPGDVLYRHSGITAQNPLRSGEEGLTLPVSPVSSTEGAADAIQAQREAFEGGVPPVHAAREGSVALEAPRTVGDITTAGGRRAMGY